MMYRWKRTPLELSLFFGCISIASLAVLSAIVRVPSELESQIWLGLSMQRMALAVLPALTALLAALASVRALRNAVWAGEVWQRVDHHQSALLRAALIVLVLGWVASCVPSYRWTGFEEYAARLQPLMVWVTMLSSFIFLLTWGASRGFRPDGIHAFGQTSKLTTVVLYVIAAVWILVAVSGLGLRISEDYWYGSGVPVLAQQVTLAIVFGLCFLVWGQTLERYFSKSTDLFIFLLVWVVAAVLWAREPVTASYFAPGPYPPGGTLHPYSDAATFDLGSQYALIGQGINNGIFFDRALYMGFLTFLHSAVGQDYSQLMAVQAAVFAVLPGILYLLGAQLHSRALGVSLAVLTALRGLNGVAAGALIDLANQKQMLTDFPLALLMAWLALVLVRWAKTPRQSPHLLLWAGGISGLGVLIRTHALFPLLFVMLMTFVVYRAQISRAMVLSVLAVAVMFAAILPWGMTGGGSVLDVLSMRIRTVIEERYLPNPEPTPLPQGNLPPSWTALSLFKAQARGLAVAQPLTVPLSITTNFFHNLVTSVFSLPLSPAYHEVKPLLKDVSPVWQQYWDGSLPFASRLIFAFNLFLISLGIALAYRSAGLAGLVPLGLFLVYQLANAFARTSGGRYIVPVDWVVLVYYALGLLQVVIWVLQTFGLRLSFENMRRRDGEFQPGLLWRRVPSILLTYLFLGGLLPLSAAVHPLRYAPRPQQELVSALDAQGMLARKGTSSSELEDLSARDPNFRIVEGRMLYPRFYAANKGESKRLYPYMTLPYPRLGFTLIGPAGTIYAVLPQSRSPVDGHASDVIVLGCVSGESMDVLALASIDSNSILLREPSASFACPPPAPPCDGNGVCR